MDKSRPFQQMFKNYPDIMSVEQLQNALHIGRAKAYQLIRDNRIKYIRIGKKIRIPKIYLIEFVCSQDDAS